LKIEPCNTFLGPRLLLYELNLAWISWNLILAFKMLGKPPNTLMNLFFFKSQILLIELLQSFVEFHSCF
jgi:hypothetical protein